MPTISKVALKIDGKDFLKVVKVDGAGLFTIQLPLCITEKLGSTYVSGVSKVEVDNAFKKVEPRWKTRRPRLTRKSLAS